MDYDTAIDIAFKAFQALHPPGSVPSWFDECASIDCTRGTGDRWTVEVTLVREPVLRPGQFWLYKNGRRLVASTDPVSGQTRVSIGPTPRPGAAFVAFRVSIAEDGGVDVLIDNDIAALDGSDYERAAPVRHR